METTIVIAVHFKVDAEGNTTEELLRNATDIAHHAAEVGARTYLGCSVEGATPLVDRVRLDAAFEAKAGLFNPTAACIRYGCHENPTTHRCNRCSALMS